jgi:hypothetical protein
MGDFTRMTTRKIGKISLSGDFLLPCDPENASFLGNGRISLRL